MARERANIEQPGLRGWKAGFMTILTVTMVMMLTVTKVQGKMERVTYGRSKRIRNNNNNHVSKRVINPPNIPQASSQAGKSAPRKPITLELTLKPRDHEETHMGSENNTTRRQRVGRRRQNIYLK